MRRLVIVGGSTPGSARPYAYTNPADELRRRCSAYCHFALEHPYLYRLMFQTDLPQATIADPTATPGLRAFDNLVAAVDRCLKAGLAPPHGDPFRLASLIWAAEHGIVLGRIARPNSPWPPLDAFVDQMSTESWPYLQPTRLPHKHNTAMRR
jgi:hypothetical protein